MSDDPEAKPGDEHDAVSDVHPANASLAETSSTRRTALGMTAAATAAILTDRAILAPSSARAEPEIVESVNGKTGKVKDIAEVDTEGTLLETQIPNSVEIGSPAYEPAEEVKGVFTPGLANGSSQAVTIDGTTEVGLPSGSLTRSGYEYELTLWLKQNASGGHRVTFASGYVLLGKEPPKINEEANAETIVQLLTRNGGTTWCVVGVAEGPAARREPREPRDLKAPKALYRHIFSCRPNSPRGKASLKPPKNGRCSPRASRARTPTRR